MNYKTIGTIEIASFERTVLKWKVTTKGFAMQSKSLKKNCSLINQL